MEACTWEHLSNTSQVGFSITNTSPCARYGHTACAVDVSEFTGAPDKDVQILVAFGFNDNDIFMGYTPLLTTKVVNVVNFTPSLLRSATLTHMISNYVADCWLFDTRTKKYVHIIRIFMGA